PKIGIGKRDPCFEIRFTRANKLRCRQQVLRAITKRAFAQVLLRSAGNSFRGRKGVQLVLVDLALFPKAPPQSVRDLPNMRDLFHGRADESGDTFPARLPNNSQAATVTARC